MDKNSFDTVSTVVHEDVSSTSHKQKRGWRQKTVRVLSTQENKRSKLPHWIRKYQARSYDNPLGNSTSHKDLIGSRTSSDSIGIEYISSLTTPYLKDLSLCKRSSTSSTVTHTIKLSALDRWRKVKRWFKIHRQMDSVLSADEIKTPRKREKNSVKRFLGRLRNTKKETVVRSIIGDSFDENIPSNSGVVMCDDVLPFSCRESNQHRIQNTYSGEYSLERSTVLSSIDITGSVADLSQIELHHPMSPSLTPGKLVLMHPLDSMVKDTAKGYNLSSKSIKQM